MIQILDSINSLKKQLELTNIKIEQIRKYPIGNLSEDYLKNRLNFLEEEKEKIEKSIDNKIKNITNEKIEQNNLKNNIALTNILKTRINNEIEFLKLFIKEEENTDLIKNKINLILKQQKELEEKRVKTMEIFIQNKDINKKSEDLRINIQNEIEFLKDSEIELDNIKKLLSEKINRQNTKIEYKNITPQKESIEKTFLYQLLEPQKKTEKLLFRKKII